MRQPTNIAIKIFMALTTVAFSWLSIAEFYRWSLLHGPTLSSTAVLTDSREKPCVGRGCFGINSSYQIKYQIKLPGDETRYSFTGQSLFFNRWVRITEKEWVDAMISNTVKVIYTPSNPRINQPFANSLPSIHNGIGFAVLALFSLFVTASYMRGKKI